MSKLSFRARALDANKSLPVHHADDVPDLPDIASVNRVVPQMPTGMEKEEETEHHLQRAISAQQIYGEAQRLIIPTPDTHLFESDYKQLKRLNVQMPKQFIHVQAFTLEDELPDYDCDDEDQKWMNIYNKTNSNSTITTLDLEKMIDTLEKGCGSRIDLFTQSDAKALLKKDEKLITALYEYWKDKRKKQDSMSLTPTVRTEKKDGSALHDPYVAFRRRIEKMQTRKNRKNDEASYEKMLKLRRDLNRACLILEMVKLREEKKRDLLQTTKKILETRYSNKDFNGELLHQCYDILRQRQLHQDHQPSTTNNTSKSLNTSDRSRESVDDLIKRAELAEEARKRHKILKQRSQTAHLSEQATTSEHDKPKQEIHARVEADVSSINEGPDGKYTFRRKKDIIYHAPRYDSMGNWPWTHPVEGGSADPRFCYCCTSIQRKCRCIGFARRRIGRGGRIHFDRAYTPYDEYLNRPNKIKVKTEDSKTNGLTSFQDRVPPWPHFKPHIDSSDEDESFPKTQSSYTNSWLKRDNTDQKQISSTPLLHRSFSSQPTSKFRIHPYPSRTNKRVSSINNQVFLASLAASFSKSAETQHWILRKNKNNHPINGTNILNSPTKVQITSQMISSPSCPPSTAPASAIYQLNFPILLSNTNSSVPTSSSNIMHRKTPNTLENNATLNLTAPIDNTSRTSQAIVVSSQPIVSRQPLSIVQQSYIPHKMIQQQNAVNSVQAQTVNSLRANKLSISKGLAISHSPVVSNGMINAPVVHTTGITPNAGIHATGITPTPGIQLARGSRDGLPNFNTFRRQSTEMKKNPTVTEVK